jgi:hypothetical protein
MNEKGYSTMDTKNNVPTGNNTLNLKQTDT